MEILVKHFSSSYSASRAALLEAWKAFRMRRSWLAADLCQPVYELFLSESIASGRLKAPGFFLDPLVRMAYCGAQWNGPAQGMIDPEKEVDAAEKRVSLGVSTRQRETIEMTGGDFDSNVAQLAREAQLMKEAGILPSAPIKQTEKKKQEEDGGDEDETEETKTDDNEPDGGEKPEPEDE